MFSSRRLGLDRASADRLWIQRQPPRLTFKRKRLISSNTSKHAKQKSSNKRQRVVPEPESSPPPASLARSSRRHNQTQAQNSSPSLSRGTRVAKLRANQKLDVQAKDLAEYQRQIARSKSANARPLTPRRPSGIRVSARLRGTLTDEVWQEVPEEWLAGSHERQEGKEKTLPDTKARLKTGLKSDEESISDLTELSEGDSQEEANTAENEEACVKEEVETESVLASDRTNKNIGVNQKDEDHPSPEDFIEWETVSFFFLSYPFRPLTKAEQVCVTLEEWENFPEQFEQATHYAEKSLYKVLSQSIVPAITAELKVRTHSI